VDGEYEPSVLFNDIISKQYMHFTHLVIKDAHIVGPCVYIVNWCIHTSAHSGLKGLLCS